MGSGWNPEPFSGPVGILERIREDQENSSRELVRTKWSKRSDTSVAVLAANQGVMDVLPKCGSASLSPSFHEYLFRAPRCLVICSLLSRILFHFIIQIAL